MFDNIRRTRGLTLSNDYERNSIRANLDIADNNLSGAATRLKIDGDGRVEAHSARSLPTIVHRLPCGRCFYTYLRVYSLIIQ